jgi:hypothetical protein
VAIVLINTGFATPVDVVRENSHVTKVLFRQFLFRLSNVLDINVNIGISGLKYMDRPNQSAFDTMAKIKQTI